MLPTWNKSASKPKIQLMDNNNSIRVPMASPKPQRRAFFCWWEGSLVLKMLMKMILSIPKTISNMVSVRSAIHASAVANIEKSMFPVWLQNCHENSAIASTSHFVLT